MKIIVITNYWIGSDGGGVKIYVKNLVDNLINAKKNVIVLFREGNDNKNYKLSLNKIKFIIDAIKILKIENPDIILCQGGWFGAIPAIIYKRYKKRTKLLYIFHTHFDRRFQYIIKNFLTNIFNRFDYICIVSNSLYQNIIDVAGLRIERNKTYTLYAGVDTKEPTDKEIKEFKKKYNIFGDYILLLGHGLTALPVKKEGAKLLIGVMKKLIKKYPKTKLILTRNGPYEIELKNYASDFQIIDHIIFTGDLKNPHVATKICDIYTHITYGEGGLSLAILEAMSFGKPIIASAVGGICEVIENKKTGILVNNDIDEIYSAIIYLIENKKIAEFLGESARHVAKEKFTWKKTISNLESILNN